MQNEVHNLTEVYCIQYRIHADCSIKNVAAIGEEGGDKWQDEVNKHSGDGRTLLAQGSAIFLS